MKRPKLGENWNSETLILLKIKIVCFFVILKIKMHYSKNILKTTLKKMERLKKMVVFSVLIIVMILVCDFLATLW
jgi:hypothetical protein